MKKPSIVRVICLAMVLVMLLPTALAAAEHITSNGSYVKTYYDRDLEKPTGTSVQVNNQNATSVDGWYEVYISEGQAWVPANSITVVGATPSPSPEPTVTITPTVPPTLAPGQTATPAPTATPFIEGDHDETYQGEILSFTVPGGTGGLWLFSTPDCTGQGSENVPEGQKLTLTTYKDAPSSSDRIYSVSFKSKIYYVPGSALLTSGTSTQMPTGNIKSVQIGDETANVYSAYNRSTHEFSGKMDGIELEAGKRFNATYIDAYAYSYVHSGTTYYFRSSAIATGSESAASVVGNDDAKLVTVLKIPENTDLKLYVSPSESSDYSTYNGAEMTLNAQNDKEGWYKVVYRNAYYYIRKADLMKSSITIDIPEGVSLYLYEAPKTGSSRTQLTGAAGGTQIVAEKYNDNWYKYNDGGVDRYIAKSELADLSVTTDDGFADGFDANQVVNNPTVETSTFYVTIGVNGGKLYTSYDAKLYDPPYVDPEIPAGSTVRVGNLNANWYTYSLNGITYYLHKTDTSGYSTSTGAVSSYKVRLYDGVKLYDRIDAKNPATVDLGFPEDGSGKVFVVTSINETFFSMEFGGRTYYIRKSELKEQNITELDPIATVTNGRTYNITLSSLTNLYSDSACKVASGITYPAGTTLKATKHTDFLYVVKVNEIDYYIKVENIASIQGGDDTTKQENDGKDTIGDVIQGEKDTEFGKNVFSYTIPTSGLWLYRGVENSNPKASVALTSGKTIQLSDYPDATFSSSWYGTWYGGELYGVRKTDLTVTSDDIKAGASFSLTLSGRVALYSDSGLKNATGQHLEAGTKVNVKVATLLSTAEKQAMPPNLVPDDSKSYVRAYSTDYAGTTRYFPAYSSFDSSAGDNALETIKALLGSSVDTSVVTRFSFADPAGLKLYTSDSTKSSSITVKPEDAQTRVTVYGIKYSDGWYKVVYNNTAWYLNLAEYNALLDKSALEQVPVANDVDSNTFTVTIGPNGAKLYTTTTANDSYAYTGADPRTLPAGYTIVANAVSSGWYATSHEVTGQTVYFQINAASNSNQNSAVRSYRITLPDTATPISVYSAIIDDSFYITRYTLKAGETHTLRTVDSKWSSVTLNGVTYYVKNSAIPSDALDGSTPIASTTVGKTYTVTLGGHDSSDGNSGIPHYNDNKLTSLHGRIPQGTTLQATKMFVEGSSTTSGLVFQCTYNGFTGFIDSKYVVGVKEGDEVDELNEANENNQNEDDIPVGSSRYYSLNAGTVLYTDANSSSTTITLPSTGTYLLTRHDANWFKIAYNGVIYYIPASQVIGSGGGSNAGANIAPGESFMHTLSNSANAYDSASLTANIVGTVLPNQLLQLTKVNDYWYELDQGTRKVYLTASDVFGAPGQTGNTGGTTTDGIGIITPTIQANPSTGTVNLRKSASTTATILARVPKGTILANGGYVVDDKNNVWYKVTYEGKSGYLSGTYVIAVGSVNNNSNQVDPSSDIGRTLAVDVATVNIRSGPGTNYSIVGRLDRNAAVIPQAYHNGTDGMVWYSFQFDAKTTGYIRYDYLRGGVASTTELSGNVAIKAGGTNLRSGAGDSFSVKAKLDRDLIVTIVGSGTDSKNVLWYRVTYENLSGYVRSDLVRQLTTSESSGLFQGITDSYTELSYGSKGAAVVTLQQKLISLGYMTGTADGTYGVQTTAAVKAFQQAKGIAASGVATAATQAALFNSSPSIGTGSTSSLDWFSYGYSLINANKNISVYDVNAKLTWNATYVEGANHADVIPASATDAQKLKANNITGSYVRRPVIVTIAGQKFAGSMYAVGHGNEQFCSWFSGVMCIHFTGSKTHGTGNVDADHQAAIQQALNAASGVY